MNDRTHLTSETIDLLTMAALSAPQAEQAQAHLNDCARCQARVSEAEEDKARFEQFVLPRTLEKVEQSARRSLAGDLARRWRMLLPVVGLLGTAAVLMVLVTRGGEEAPYLGIKGLSRPAMDVVAQRVGSGQFQVKDGAHLRPGDRIRFVVDPAVASYVLIASRDGAGNFTVYYPYGGQMSAALAPGRQELPGSIELDEVPGTERLVAVFSQKPIPAERVKSALAEGAALPEATALSWEFVKVSP